MARNQNEHDDRQRSSGRSSSGSGSSSNSSSGKHSLQAREYRDRHGDEHHHTKSYMDQHSGSRENSDRSDR